jgi:cell division protein FtsB
MKIANFGSTKVILKKIVSLLLNKYILAFTLFAFWISFFDKNALVTQLKLVKTIHELEDEKVYLISEIEVTKQMKKDITDNQEKFAREKFYMKKPGEQVFIIEK